MLGEVGAALADELLAPIEEGETHPSSPDIDFPSLKICLRVHSAPFVSVLVSTTNTAARTARPPPGVPLLGPSKFVRKFAEDMAEYGPPSLSIEMA